MKAHRFQELEATVMQKFTLWTLVNRKVLPPNQTIDAECQAARHRGGRLNHKAHELVK